MMYLGIILALVGALLGMVGDAPINHLGYRSMELMIAGGLMVAAGVAMTLLGSADRGGRSDEPPGHINP